MNKIGLIYMMTGYYCHFWHEFYTSCEKYLCVDAEKGYEVFTDSSELLKQSFPNVTMYSIEDKGWVVNVSSKSEFICSIREHLLTNYDYIFYLNGNFRCLKPVYCDEILPGIANGYFAALSFEHNSHKSPDELAYDRNVNCHAYIPYGKGIRYYQASLYGGRTEEVLRFSDWSRDLISKDLSNGIIARYHDESYLNCYLQDANPLVLNDIYGYSDFSPYRGEYKVELINKNHFLGIGLLDARSLLPAGQVKLQGGLGEQMFCFAYYCYLCRIWRDNGKKKAILSLPPVNGYTVDTLFNVFPIDLIDDIKIVERQLPHLPAKDVVKVAENYISIFHQVEEPDYPVTIYEGKWQCYQYVVACEEELRKHFRFSESRLDEKHSKRLNSIRNSAHSVSVHIPSYFMGTQEPFLIKKAIEKYYDQALRNIRSLLQGEPDFFFFRDAEDVSEDWQDMFLMSECKHHIVANNSFSWWSAWLGHHQEGVVIAPEPWSYWEDTPDILPPDWLKLPLSVDEEQLECAVGQLMLEHVGTDDLGLYNGKMGLIIFFYHYARLFNNPWYEEYAAGLLDELYEDIHWELPVNFSSGLCGIGWGIEYLVQQGFVSGCTDDVLSDLDKKVMERDLRRIEDASLASGLRGIACYVASRLLSSRDSFALPFDAQYLRELEEASLRLGLKKETSQTIENILPEMRAYCTVSRKSPSLWWAELYCITKK
nr:alpha-1,2-fucosyltransferase [uncultured Bacteroides sp.]